MKLTKGLISKLSRKAPSAHQANKRLDPSEVKQKATPTAARGGYSGQKWYPQTKKVNS